MSLTLLRLHLYEPTQSNKGKKRKLFLINPPYSLLAESWQQQGFDLHQILIINTRNAIDTLWACEQLLQSHVGDAILCWTNNFDLSNKHLRRLQLQLESHRCWLVLLREQRYLKQSSIAGLRIAINSDRLGRLDLHISKQINGWGGQQCTLSLPPYYENWQRLPSTLLPVNNSPLAQQALEKLAKHARKIVNQQVDTQCFSQHISSKNGSDKTTTDSNVYVIASLAQLGVVH